MSHSGRSIPPPSHLEPVCPFLARTGRRGQQESKQEPYPPTCGRNEACPCSDLPNSAGPLVIRGSPHKAELQRPFELGANLRVEATGGGEVAGEFGRFAGGGQPRAGLFTAPKQVFSPSQTTSEVASASRAADLGAGSGDRGPQDLRPHVERRLVEQHILEQTKAEL